MSISKMNTFIDLIETISSKDDEGFITKSDTVLTSIRAYQEHRSGSRKWANLTAFTEADALFQMRVIPALEVKPGMIITCDTGRYTIISVERIRGLYLEALARKIEPTTS